MDIKLRTVCILALLSSASANADVILDSFEAGPVTVTADDTNGNVTVPQENLAADDVFLGLRRTTVQGDLASGSVQAVISGGTATYISNNPQFNESTIFGISFDGRLLLTYLADNRFEPFDLTTLPGDTFAIDVDSVDFGGDAAIDASVSLGGGNIDFNIVESVFPYTIFVPFSDLADAGSDLSDAINLTFDFSQIGPSTSFSIESIRVVPEPTTAVLVGFGISLLLPRRRRLTTCCS